MIRCIAKTIYHLIGWKLVGRYPSEIEKKIIIVAPHTSTMDFFVGILVKFSLNMEVIFYGKKELFKGFVGWFLKIIGGKPIDRFKNNNLVSTAVADFQAKESHTILLAPEGTRRRVDRFKSGFYYIALKAKVPIVPIGFDFNKKEIVILPIFWVEGRGEEEIEEIRQMFRSFKGRVAKNGIS